MPYITNDYDPEIYDQYDITAMDNRELLICCKQIVNEEEFDEATTEVLCWGILKATEEKDEMSQEEIETVASDGTVIKSDFYSQNCGSTFMAITYPYRFCVSKDELVRDLNEILIEAYNDYQRLHNMENEVRALYPRYQAELAKCKDAGGWQKRCAFDDVYSAIISESIITYRNMVELFNKWWGLEFYNPDKYGQK